MQRYKNMLTRDNNNVVIADHEYALQSGMPNECTYADDHDDITLHQQRQNLFSKMVKEVLEKENLFINESKTEHIVIKKDTRINEKWRLAKKLGTLLGDSEDIARRKQLACASMKSTKQLWTRRKLTKLNTKLKLHRTLVKSVLTYNLKTCGFTEYDRKKLDSSTEDSRNEFWVYLGQTPFAQELYTRRPNQSLYQ